MSSRKIDWWGGGGLKDEKRMLGIKTKFTEVNQFAFVSRLFHEDFSPIVRIRTKK